MKKNYLIFSFIIIIIVFTIMSLIKDDKNVWNRNAGDRVALLMEVFKVIMKNI